jgi:putative FmdB family regulatory protein
MPIYEYRCDLCGAVSEFLLRVGDDEPIRCKKCGSPK